MAFLKAALETVGKKKKNLNVQGAVKVCINKYKAPEKAREG